MLPRAPATCTLSGPESLEGVCAGILDWVDYLTWKPRFGTHCKRIEKESWPASLGLGKGIRCTAWCLRPGCLTL